MCVCVVGDGAVVNNQCANIYILCKGNLYIIFIVLFCIIIN